jgi:hypothetical protein
MDNRDDLNTNRSLGSSDANRNVNQHGVTDTTGDVVGEVTGGVAGAATGAALGSLGGPIGTLIGGLAGAIGGWWSGRAISEAASSFSDEDESYYRTAHTSSASQLADRSTHDYDNVRPAYQLGHLASRNPDYANRNFDEVETDLQRGWTGDVASRHGDWNSVRGYARSAFERGRGGMSSGAMGAGAVGAGAMGTSSLGSASIDSTASGVARTADRLDDNADRLGDRTENAAHRAGNALENAWDKTKAGAERLGDKIADTADDTKDRVDGNPASRPGIDPTDRRF